VKISGNLYFVKGQNLKSNFSRKRKRKRKNL